MKKYISNLLSNNPLCGIETYTDTLDLSNGNISRIIKKLVLTGSQDETWAYSISSGIYRARFENLPNAAITECLCTHYKYEFANADGNIFVNSTLRQVTFCDNINAIDDTTWRTFLVDQYVNNTPVTIWFVLATSETDTITVPTGLSGTVNGYLTQTGTPTPTVPIYPTANPVTMWADYTPNIYNSGWTTASGQPEKYNGGWS